MRTDFVEWAKDLRRLGNKTVTNAFNKSYQSLYSLCQHPTEEKRSAYADFLDDQIYYDNLSNPSFIFAFRPVKSVSHNPGKDCLIQFYNFLTATYPNSLVPNWSLNSAFHRTDIIAGYRETNPFIESVCPSCDSQLTESPGAN